MNIPFGMNATIVKTSLAAGGVGIPGAFGGPHVDVPALIGLWAVMFVRLADQAGSALDRHTATKLATGVALAVGGFGSGVKLATTAFAATGIGTVPALIANISLNAVVTWLVGRAAAHIFTENDTEQTVENLVRAIVAMLGFAPKPAA